MTVAFAFAQIWKKESPNSLKVWNWNVMNIQRRERLTENFLQTAYSSLIPG